MTSLVHDEKGYPTTNPEIAEKLITRLSKKITDHVDDIVASEAYLTDDADIVIVAYGAVARSAKKVVKDARAAGLKVGLFRPITIWPFPEKELRELARHAHTFIVPEMNLGQLKLEVERVACNAKIIGVNKVSGELITPGEILDAITKL